MRNIDKRTILSKSYREWLKSIGSQKHPKYSSQNKFYIQVKMSLLNCQEGLCAYTEKRICSLEMCRKTKWDSCEEYPQIKNTDGDIEHFDSSLKEEKGWDWDNLFVTVKFINNSKGTSEVHYFFKPDSSSYNPFVILEYDCQEHTYFAHSMIKDEKKVKEIHEMIITLGLNNFSIIDNRKEAFRKLKLYMQTKNVEYDYVVNEIICEFPTAFSLCKEILMNEIS